MKVLEFLNSNFNILALAIMVLGLLVFVIMKAEEISKLSDIEKKLEEIEHDAWWCRDNTEIIKGESIANTVNTRSIKLKLDDLFNSVVSNGNYIRKSLSNIDNTLPVINTIAHVTKDKVNEAVNNEVVIMNQLEKMFDSQEHRGHDLDSIYRCLDARSYVSNKQTKQIYKLMKNWGKVKNESN